MGQMMLRALFGRIWPYIAVVGAVLVSLFAVRQSGKAAGREDIKHEINEAERKASERARHVENETAAMGDDAIADELIRDWVRDKRR